VQRIAENIDVFDFDLITDELAAIDALDTGRRGGRNPNRSGWGTSDDPSPRTEPASIGYPPAAAALRGPIRMRKRP
jgi:hypothetical protein